MVSSTDRRLGISRLVTSDEYLLRIDCRACRVIAATRGCAPGPCHSSRRRFAPRSSGSSRQFQRHNLLVSSLLRSASRAESTCRFRRRPARGPANVVSIPRARDRYPRPRIMTFGRSSLPVKPNKPLKYVPPVSWLHRTQLRCAA